MGATGAVAWLVVRRWGRDLGGVPLVIGFAILWLTAILGVHLAPGAVGELGRAQVCATALVLLAAVFAITRARRGERGEAPVFPAAPDSGLRSWLFAAVAFAATLVIVAFLGMEDAYVAPAHIDVTSFHLPNVARWIQHSTMWQIDDFIPDRSPGYYPGTGDVFSLSVMLPWRSDFLVRFVNYPLLVLVGLSCYALARELRAPAATAALLATTFVAMPVVSWVAFSTLADTSMLAPFAAGAFFLVRYWRTGNRFDLVLAALGLGLSLGTRWYAVPAVGAVVLVWFAAGLVAGGPRRPVIARLAGITGLVLLAGGFWLVRNWAFSDNPLYPLKVEPLGLTIFDAPHDEFRDLQGYTILHYLFDGSIWTDYLWPSFLDAMSWAAVALWAGLLAGGLIALWRFRIPAERRGDAGKILALCLAALIIGIAYMATPYSATGVEGEPLFANVNSRYVLPALVLAVPVGAWALRAAGAWRQLVELIFVGAVLDGLRRTLDLPGPDLGAKGLAQTLVLLGTAAVAAGILWFLWQRGRRVAFAAVVVLALVVTAAGFRKQETSYADQRYTALPVFGGFQNQPPGTRVGIIGEGWGNYAYFGPEFRTEVEYIGPRRQHLLTTYRRKRDLQAAVDRGNYDFVVVQEISSLDATLPKRQERWLKERGWTEIAGGAQVFAGGPAIRVYKPPGQ